MGDGKSTFLTVAELANELSISTRHIYDLMQRGAIPYKQFGTRRVVPRAWLEQQVEEAMQPPGLIDLAALRTTRRQRKKG